MSRAASCGPRKTKPNATRGLRFATMAEARENVPPGKMNRFHLTRPHYLNSFVNAAARDGVPLGCPVPHLAPAAMSQTHRLDLEMATAVWGCFRRVSLRSPRQLTLLKFKRALQDELRLCTPNPVVQQLLMVLYGDGNVMKETLTNSTRCRIAEVLQTAIDPRQLIVRG
eukprot:TRINITY_DN11866_c0_g1_i2.p1 TRINITY_DN11866_c0_g1~~TRINITY_DN11866_c0_g1_i2.p1  ORF type:complete len:169 (+),score=16.55 TRINITY_DN11866_c0_g1_i2:216-722(+)